MIDSFDFFSASAPRDTTNRILTDKIKMYDKLGPPHDVEDFIMSITDLQLYDLCLRNEKRDSALVVRFMHLPKNCIKRTPIYIYQYIVQLLFIVTNVVLFVVMI